jgi:lipopolysaccharide export system permease protein
MLGRLDRYLLREATKVFLAIMLVLVLILASLMFLRTLEEVNLGGLGVDVVFHYLSLQIQRDLSSLLPPAFFLAILVTLARLARDSELIAMQACGVGPPRLYRTFLVLAVPVALVTGWVALDLKPRAAAGIQEIRLQQKEQAAQIAGLQPGRFYVEERGEVVVYIGEIDQRKSLGDVFVLDRRGEKTRLVVSEAGRHRIEESTGDHLVTLTQGHRFDGQPGSGAYLIGDFDQYELRFADEGQAKRASNKRATIATPDLMRSDELADRIELEHRLAAPISILTLVRCFMCGIVGIFGRAPVGHAIYDALLVFQHRGQDAAGIVTQDQRGILHLRKENGLGHAMSSSSATCCGCKGNIGIGHVRYPTAGSSSSPRPSPSTSTPPTASPWPTTATSPMPTSQGGPVPGGPAPHQHHLRLRGAAQHLRPRVAAQGNGCPSPRAGRVPRRARGASALPRRLCGGGHDPRLRPARFRDPFGIRPVVFGKRETPQGGRVHDRLRERGPRRARLQAGADIAPGEAVFIDMQAGCTAANAPRSPVLTPCIFEFVYFARPTPSSTPSSSTRRAPAWAPKPGREDPRSGRTTTSTW